jgi:periplasmic protein CpxP/Spy
MKILKIFLILCSIVLVLNASGKDEYKHSYKNLDYLNLNPSQVKAIKNILLDLKDEYKKFYEYKDDIEDELEDLIEDSKFDEKLYFEKVMEMKKRATILESKRIKKILEILDEKQRDEFADHFKEWIIE